MKKLILALTTALLVTIACGASATPIPTFDPGTIQTAIFSTAWAALNQTQTANPPTNTPIPADTLVATNLPPLPDTPLPTLVLPPTTIPSTANSLLFTFLNVGQGDATLIQMSDGKTVLIDGGESDSGIVSQLQALGVQRIDLMIATHPHSDHIGGLVPVLQNFPVSKVVTSGQSHTTSVYEHFLDGIASAQAEYIEVKRGDVISLSGVNFQVLNPPNFNNPDLNENSVVLQFKVGQTTFLMMGDSGADTEASLISAGLLQKIDILKIGHHASTTGSTLAFLNLLQPTIALYSAGINNQYGHPAPLTIASLTSVIATVYGTDKNGVISIQVDQNGYTINASQGLVTAPLALPTAIIPILPILPPAGTGALEIVSITSPISKGANATLTAQTSPSASCSITVYYKSGPSQAAGLEPKTASPAGLVSWTWKVGAKTTSGNWPIEVTCNNIIKETTFMVQ